MKAIILAGGKGTRLEPLTFTTPKALVPVLNVPFLEYAIRNLANQQVTETVLALSHLSQPISDFLRQGDRFGTALSYSIEETPLGSAGAAKQAGKNIKETFLVFNGDNFIDFDLAEMLALHRRKKAKVTLLLTRVDNPTAYGLVETETDGKVRRFLEKPKPEEVTTDTVNAGAWLVEPGVMSLVPDSTVYSFERDVFPRLLNDNEPIYAITSSGYWMDTGTPEKYLQLHRDLLSGKSSQFFSPPALLAGQDSKVHPLVQISGKVIIGTDCEISSGVKLTGPVVIGDGSAIGENCELENTVIWKNVRLEAGVRLKNSVIADNCRLGAGVSGESIMLADGVTVPANHRFEPGARVRPGVIVS